MWAQKYILMKEAQKYLYATEHVEQAIVNNIHLHLHYMLVNLRTYQF